MSSLTARLFELEDRRCRLDYESEFSAPRGRENQTRAGILAAYAVMFRGLQDAAARDSALPDRRTTSDTSVHLN